MTAKRNTIKYIPNAENVNTKKMSSYKEFIGITTTFYSDPITKKQKEGRAKILDVIKAEQLTINFKILTCEVTFIGDRGRKVIRTIIVRNMETEQLSLLPNK